MFTRVFGATDSAQLKAKIENSWKELLNPIEDLFLNDAAAIAALQRADVPEKASAFVTFEPRIDRKMRCEKAANARVLQFDRSKPQLAVEADLQSLTRDFGACAAIPLLYGQDFLDRNESLLANFWKFDNDALPLLMLGCPIWLPLTGFKEGIAARARLSNAMEALYRCIDQHQSGQHIDFGADLSDISRAALRRNAVYHQKQWSFRERAGGDLAIL